MSMFITPSPTVFTPRKAASLYDKPSSPSSYDDEFESVSLDPKWTIVTDGAGSFDNVNGIDAYTGFSSGHRSSHNSYRKSWMMAQPATTGVMYMYQSVSLPTNCFIWYRASFCHRYSGITNNDNAVGLRLGQLASGVPSLVNNVYSYVNESDGNTVQAQGGMIVASVDTSSTSGNVGPQTVGTDTLSQPVEFGGVQKVGTTYHIFAGTGTGNWLHLRTVTYAGTIDIMSFYFANVSTSSPGNMILGVDFVRVVTGKFLP